MAASSSHELISQLRSIVGRRHVLVRSAATRRFATGYRHGGGPVAAVVCPGSLVEQWRTLQMCVAADHIVISQAANTGLTGGSTPFGTYDRPVVIVSMRRLSTIHVIRNGSQVVCLPGATLFELERRLAPMDREPHSVIGSSCIGASVIGGICNNSGGSLVRRGPAYTEYSLFARVDEQGHVSLHNHLGIDLGDQPEDMLRAVESGPIQEDQINDESRAASSCDYDHRVRDIDAHTPARFNADPARLYEAAGSAGRLMVFAVRLDTYPRDATSATYYVGTNDEQELTRLRRVILRDFRTLPSSAEYIHRDAFELADRWGKDIFLAIRYLGTDRLPRLFALKNFIDALAQRLGFLPTNLADRLMQSAGRLFPDHLPARMRAYCDRYEHHLILKVSGSAIEQARALLADIFPSATGDAFECSEDESARAFLHRFAVASAAIRYRALHEREVEDLIALDIALPRNELSWQERLPADMASSMLKPIYYGHFLCHVFHQDYLVRKGHDPASLERRMWALLDSRGAEYPAEHNVGHHYPAKPALTVHYRRLDPGNQLNPGIGQTSRERNWN